MGGVTRFWSHEASNIRCVRESDFDVAQSELAALREELATAKRNEHNSEVAYKAAIEKQEELRDRKNSIVVLQQRLTAAEQRNAELVASVVALPDEFKELSGCENTAGVYACIDYISDWVAELAKPTESGESE